jgi:hypothetical protein
MSVRDFIDEVSVKIAKMFCHALTLANEKHPIAAGIR